MKINKDFYKKLDLMVPNPKCSLDYTKDYELLIATVLSAQCTDERVNKITPSLWGKYDIFSLANAKIEDVREIIRPLGNMNRRSEYIITIAKSLVDNYNGKVPNDRAFLESLPGVGRKTANVVLANIFDVPAFAVDTHVDRVSKRLGLANNDDSPLEVERKLMNLFPEDKWLRLHHQFLLLGRYTCLSRSPQCEKCLLKEYCRYYTKK
jgi:endonuclease-3